MVNFEASIELDPNAVANKLESLLDDETMTDIQWIFAEEIDPWTPFLTGALSIDIDINANGVTYNVPYARRRYYEGAVTKTFHPLATGHWDEVAMESQSEVVSERIKELLIKKAQQLYG